MRRAPTFLVAVLISAGLSITAEGADRYRVTLVLYPGNDASSVAKRLAATYHGTIATPIDDSGTFVITLSSATARLLGRDPHGARVQAQTGQAVTPDAATTWTSGNYEYDGAGNIKKLGTVVYVYDTESLTYEKAGTQTRQALTYDGFGNIRSITEGSSAFTVGARVSLMSSFSDGTMI